MRKLMIMLVALFSATAFAQDTVAVASQEQAITQNGLADMQKYIKLVINVFGTITVKVWIMLSHKCQIYKMYNSFVVITVQ